MADAPPQVETRGGGWVLVVASESRAGELTSLLEAGGWTTAFAPGPDEALEFVDAAEFDLVVFALEVPTRACLEAMRRLREMERSRVRRTPVLGLAVEDSEDMRWRCLDAGMDEILLLPLDVREFERALQRVGDAAPDLRPEHARVMVQGSDRRLRSTLEHFVGQLPERVATVREAVDGLDADEAGRVAHALECSAHRLAMPRLRDLSHRIAAHARRGELEEAARLVRELDGVVDRGASAARRVIAGA